MKTILFILTSTLAVSAFAYKDGTYTCKNSDPTVPPNEYKVETHGVGTGALPYMEITLHYRLKAGDENSPVLTTKTRGLATVTETGSSRALLIAAMRFEFDGDKLLNCRP